MNAAHRPSAHELACHAAGVQEPFAGTERQLVEEAHGEGVRNIVRADGLLQRAVVIGLPAGPAARLHVPVGEALGPGVRGEASKTERHALLHLRLEGVVRGVAVGVGALADGQVLRIRPQRLPHGLVEPRVRHSDPRRLSFGRSGRAAQQLSQRQEPRVELVDVHEVGSQPRALVAHVIGLHHKARGQLALDAEGPVLEIRRAPVGAADVVHRLVVRHGRCNGGRRREVLRESVVPVERRRHAAIGR